MGAAKLFALKFGHQAVKTLVGCCGRNMDSTAFWQDPIYRRQHHDKFFFSHCATYSQPFYWLDLQQDLTPRMYVK